MLTYINTFMYVNSFCAGLSFSAGTYTVPIASINTQLTALGAPTIATTDSIERLMAALLQILYLKGQAGTITEINSGHQVSTISNSVGSWEVSSNTYSDRLISSYLYSADMGSGTTTLVLDADGVTSYNS
jgi:hypothetical protein